MIRKLGRNIDPTTAIVIFPEGRLFRPDRLERAKTRLDPRTPNGRHDSTSLGHVLPARPSGVLALVDVIAADVVFIAHTGLDQYPSFTELAKACHSATRSTSMHGESRESKSQTGTPNESSGSTNNGCSSTTGSRPAFSGHGQLNDASDGGRERRPTVITDARVTRGSGVARSGHECGRGQRRICTDVRTLGRPAQGTLVEPLR